MSEKDTFQDFLASIDGENPEFVRELHGELTARGCMPHVKSLLFHEVKARTVG